MIIACPACATRYVVPDSSIGIDGRTVRCAKCRHSWFQEGPEVELPEPAPAEPEPLAAAQHKEEPRAPESPSAPDTHPAIATEPSAPSPEPEQISDKVQPDAETAEQSSADEPSSDAPVAQEAADEPAKQSEDTAESEEPAATDLPVEAEDPPIAVRVEESSTEEAQPQPESSYYAEDDDHPSRFAYEPPFRPRLNRPKMLMIGAILFAFIAAGIGGYIWRYGMPAWAKAPAGTFAQAQPDLVLDFPEERQDRRTLPNGTEFYGASGTVTNVGSTERSVPSILIVMRDARNRIVYSWEVVPPKRRLAPGETVTINEAVTDVPKSAKFAEIGWKPG